MLWETFGWAIFWVPGETPFPPAWSQFEGRISHRLEDRRSVFSLLLMEELQLTSSCNPQHRMQLHFWSIHFSKKGTAWDLMEGSFWRPLWWWPRPLHHHPGKGYQVTLGSRWKGRPKTRFCIFLGVFKSGFWYLDFYWYGSLVFLDDSYSGLHLIWLHIQHFFGIWKLGFLHLDNW